MARIAVESRATYGESRWRKGASCWRQARLLHITPDSPCDEAQLVGSDALTDLRLLVSAQDSDRLKIVLAGQKTLRDQLRRSRHHDLVHRLSVRYHVPPLTAEGTAQYIDQQLRRVGSNEKLFDAAAKRLIHDYATGLPRQINNLATACLIHAATSGEKKIDEKIVAQVSQEVSCV